MRLINHIASYILLISYILLFALTMSCVKSPSKVEHDLEINIPKQWSSESNRSSYNLDKWWESFYSEELDSLIEEGFQYNRDLKAAAARIEIADAYARVAGASLYPQIGSTFNASRERQILKDYGVDGDIIRNNVNNFGVSLNISWELDLWGKIRAMTKAAIADLEATYEIYNALALSTAGQIAKAWFALIEAGQQLELVQKTVNNYEETARYTANRVNRGIQAPNDKYLAYTNLEQAKELLQQQKEILDQTKRQLEVLLGRYPLSKINVPEKLPLLPASVPAGVPAEIIGRRPDLRAEERRLTAALERIKGAKGELYPSISITGSGGRASTDFDDLLSGDFGVWKIAGNLLQPIFQGGRLRAQVMVRKGEFKEAAENFAQSALTAFMEVELTLTSENILLERESVLANAVDRAKKALEISLNRYAQGVESFIVVLESQRRALDVERMFISVRRQILDNRVDLYLALGGGFENNEVKEDLTSK
jgi:NodT family efflux transporter outer membrane factor (OMF) lipoprotein